MPINPNFKNELMKYKNMYEWLYLKNRIWNIPAEHTKKRNVPILTLNALIGCYNVVEKFYKNNLQKLKYLSVFSYAINRGPRHLIKTRVFSQE